MAKNNVFLVVVTLMLLISVVVIYLYLAGPQLLRELGVWGTKSEDCSYYAGGVMKCSFNDDVKCSAMDIGEDDRLSIAFVNLFKKIPAAICGDLGGTCVYSDCHQCEGPYVNAEYEVHVNAPHEKLLEPVWIDYDGQKIHISISQFREERPSICPYDYHYVTFSGYVLIKPKLNGEPTPYCGNGVCEVGEDATNCPQDCEGVSGTLVLQLAGVLVMTSVSIVALALIVLL